jgi:hypothetical protein
MKYITNNTKIILFIKGKAISVEKTDKRYSKIVKVFDFPLDEQEDEVLKILEPLEVSIKTIHGQNGFEVVNDDIFYKGEKLPNTFSTKIKSIIRDGLPLDHFEKFWENLQQNPSANSINELIDFLSNKELPITDDGFFIAYKGVDTNYYSIKGNINTKVLNGLVDSFGKIYNGVGEYISVARNQVDDDRNQNCSFGLHVGQLIYSQSFGEKTVVVKINPKDVVSVPTDSSFMKCRVCAYEVVSEYVHEIESSVVDSSGQETIVTSDVKNRNEFIDKVSTYLKNKSDKGVTQATVRMIQNSFSPIWPSKESILDALQSLEYYWKIQDGVVVIELNSI